MKNSILRIEGFLSISFFDGIVNCDDETTDIARLHFAVLALYHLTDRS